MLMNFLMPEEDALWVPALWWYEISDALVVAQRRHRLTEADRFSLLGRLQGLAHAHGLSAYDAAYLELAIRKSASLVTLDRKLAMVARQVGIGLRKER